MLSAVEHFGPLIGPPSTLPQAYSDRGYAIDIASANAHAFSIPPPTTTTTPLPVPYTTTASRLLQLQHNLGHNFVPPSSPTSLPQRLLLAIPTRTTASSLEPNNSAHNSVSQPNHQRSLNHPFKSRKESTIMSINKFTAPPPKRQNHQLNKLPLAQDQFSPMNLAAHTNNAPGYAHSCLQATELSRPSSSSSSVDVENDGSMSPISVTHQGPSSELTDKQAPPKSQLSYDENTVTTAAAIMAAYQLNYPQLYAAQSGLYNAPVIFPTHHPHATLSSHSHAGPFLSTLPHSGPEAGLYGTSDYIKTVPNSVGVFSNGGAYPPVSLASVNAAYNKSKTPNALTNVILTSVPVGGGSNALVTIPLAKAEARQKSQLDMSKEQQQTSTSKLPGGTYLHDKVKSSSKEALDSENYFKVPSGKEGSLKHRILTRPMNLEKTEASKVPVMRTHNSTSNFKKGSFIDLANGELRRVEDMRTDDFIQCAERSPHHQLIESTVVKISNPQPNTVVIAFSYNRNRAKVEIEVSSEHPFFVYGQGWASCNPELSLKTFGLRCQRLQVGDICISLTKREPQPVPRELNLMDMERTSSNSFNSRPSATSHYANMPKGAYYMPSYLGIPTVYGNNTDLATRLSPKSMEQLYRQQQQQQQQTMAPPSAESKLTETEEQRAARKRRWSAPDSFSNSDEEDAAVDYRPPQRLPSAGGGCYKNAAQSTSRRDCEAPLFK